MSQSNGTNLAGNTCTSSTAAWQTRGNKATESWSTNMIFTNIAAVIEKRFELCIRDVLFQKTYRKASCSRDSYFLPKDVLKSSHSLSSLLSSPNRRDEAVASAKQAAKNTRSFIPCKGTELWLSEQSCGWVCRLLQLSYPNCGQSARLHAWQYCYIVSSCVFWYMLNFDSVDGFWHLNRNQGLVSKRCRKSKKAVNKVVALCEKLRDIFFQYSESAATSAWKVTCDWHRTNLQ